jgi:hypothetical protein
MDQDTNLCTADKKNSAMANSACDQNSELYQEELKQSKVSWNEFINWKKNPRKHSRAFPMKSFKQILNPKKF